MAVIEYDANGNGHNESGRRIAETLSVTQLFRLFPDSDACYAWLESARWNGTPVCPHCGGIENIRPRKGRPHWYNHKDCRKDFSVTVGTCMHSTKRPLQDWIYAIYSVLTARKGVSAMQLSKELGTQYKTAWHMLHRIREACGRGDFTLGNVVEVDETYIGGLEKNKHESKKLHAGRGGKVKAKPVPATDAATLVPFVEDSVEAGSTLYTDDAAAYGALPTILNQYEHETVAHGKGEYVRGAAHTNGIESVWAVLKRSITGIWHHVSPKHLGRYVNEASFRLNEGNCEVDTLERMEALAAGIGGKRLKYADLIKDNGVSNKPVAA